VEERREGRPAVRALWVSTAVAVCSKQRWSSSVPMPINRRRRVLLFEDEVQPSCFAEERMRLRDLSLLVGITVYLEGCLRFGEEGAR
jgi:hypothetical protein